MSRKLRSLTQVSQRSQVSQQTIEESFASANVNIDEHVNNLVRYIVNRAGEHKLIKHSEIKKNVTPKAGQDLQEIVNKCTAILKNVYGYNMTVVDATQNSTKAYIISNALPFVNDPAESVNDQEYPEDAYKILLLLILSHIFMAGNSVNEVSLYAFLKALKIDVERRHNIFGNVKDYITNTLKNEKYLNMEIDQLSKKISFSWGPRAEKEISKHALLKFVCKMYKDRIPSSWVNHYKTANEQGFENYLEGQT